MAFIFLYRFTLAYFVVMGVYWLHASMQRSCSGPTAWPGHQSSGHCEAGTTTKSKNGKVYVNKLTEEGEEEVPRTER